MSRLKADARDGVVAAVDRYRNRTLGREGLAHELIALGFSRAEAVSHAALVEATDV